jgi:D-alanine-D-alanine ligase
MKTIRWVWEDPDAQRIFQELVGFPDAAQSAIEVDKIETLLGLSPPLDLLDVGCGTGRHALEFARRGYRVVGIDVAERYLRQARARATEEELDVELRRQRGSELTARAAYDVALAYDHTLGFMSADELRRHFGCIHRALKPGGRFLFKYAGPRLVSGEMADAERTWSQMGRRLILEEKVFEDGYRLERCIVVDVDTGHIEEFKERQRAFSLSMIRERLEAAGFEGPATYLDLDGTSATPEDFGVFVCCR